MAHKAHYNRDPSGSHRISSSTSEREQQRQSRQNQLRTAEANDDDHTRIFEPPQRVPPERQDSISRNIKNILGNFEDYLPADQQPNKRQRQRQTDRRRDGDRSSSSSRASHSNHADHHSNSSSSHNIKQEPPSSESYSRRKSSPPPSSSRKSSSWQHSSHSSRHSNQSYDSNKKDRTTTAQAASFKSEPYTNHDKKKDPPFPDTKPQHRDSGGGGDRTLSPRTNRVDLDRASERGRLQSFEMEGAMKNIFEEVLVDMELGEPLSNLHTPNSTNSSHPPSSWPQSSLKYEDNHSSANGGGDPYPMTGDSGKQDERTTTAVNSDSESSDDEDSEASEDSDEDSGGDDDEKSQTSTKHDDWMLRTYIKEEEEVTKEEPKVDKNREKPERQHRRSRREYDRPSSQPVKKTSTVDENVKSKPGRPRGSGNPQKSNPTTVPPQQSSSSKRNHKSEKSSAENKAPITSPKPYKTKPGAKRSVNPNPLSATPPSSSPRLQNKNTAKNKGPTSYGVGHETVAQNNQPSPRQCTGRKVPKPTGRRSGQVVPVAPVEPVASPPRTDDPGGYLSSSSSSSSSSDSSSDSAASGSDTEEESGNSRVQQQPPPPRVPQVVKPRPKKAETAPPQAPRPAPPSTPPNTELRRSQSSDKKQRSVWRHMPPSESRTPAHHKEQKRKKPPVPVVTLTPPVVTQPDPAETLPSFSSLTVYFVPTSGQRVSVRGAQGARAAISNPGGPSVAPTGASEDIPSDSNMNFSRKKGKESLLPFTGSQTDKPTRFAPYVEVTIAHTTSSDLPTQPSNSSSSRKRSFPVNRSPQSSHTSLQYENRPPKFKRSPPSPQPAFRDSVPPTSSVQPIDDNKQWKTERSKEPSSAYRHPSSNQHLGNSTQSTNHDKNTHPVSPAATVTPGASVPEELIQVTSTFPEQESGSKNPDYYMKKGKDLKHDGDALMDSRTASTKQGQSLNRALCYFDAALCFLMGGYALERDSENDKNEGNVGRTARNHSPTSMYNQTINLLSYVRSMRPKRDEENVAFHRLNVSCLRCQALLHVRIYVLKKDVAKNFSEMIAEQFIKTNRSNNRTPSPWHHPSVNGSQQSGRSPISPAVPSPYGTSGGQQTTIEPVSSTTQIKSSPSHGNLVPSKLCDAIKHYHGIMNNLMMAHEKWEMAREMIAKHKLESFFTNVETFSNIKVMFDMSLMKMVTFHNVVLHHLRNTEAAT